MQPLPAAVGPAAADPGETVAARAGLRLAFVSALQNLSARERGALILREVLGFSAAETAEVLGGTVAATNSALQRARARLRDVPGGDHTAPEPPAAAQRAWVERYLRAFERADVDGIKRLLTDDVIMEMPPMLNWFSGPDNYAVFMDWVFAANGTEWRVLPVTANGGQPGFAAYVRDGAAYRRHTLQILTVAEGGIARNSVFLNDAIFAAFSLPATL